MQVDLYIQNSFRESLVFQCVGADPSRRQKMGQQSGVNLCQNPLLLKPGSWRRVIVYDFDLILARTRESKDEMGMYHVDISNGIVQDWAVTGS